MTTHTFDPTEPVAPSAADAMMARASARRLASELTSDGDQVLLCIGDGSRVSEPVSIPTSAFRLFVGMLAEMGSGNAVHLVPHHAELTTQEAAELLNVSRPYLVRILDEGRIPFHRVGTHRRVMFQDVMAYKTEHRRARSAALDQLSDLDQELGLT